MLSFFIFSNSPILCQVSFQLYSNFISTIFTRASKFKRVHKKTQINFLDLYVILWILTIYYLLDKFSTTHHVTSHHHHHQWVIMTRWCVFLVLPTPCWPPKQPTSCYDSLVCFSCSPCPSLTTTTTNESWWFVGELHSSSLTTKTMLPTTHQQVLATRWWDSSPPHHLPPPPPTSPHDLLMIFLALTPPTTTANESRWLVGGILHPPCHLPPPLSLAHVRWGS